LAVLLPKKANALEHRLRLLSSPLHTTLQRHVLGFERVETP
jgi:hypothetical protein